jgi:chemotaxis protein MotB
MSGKTERPIVIVKRIRRGEEQGHGGAWKVAYADFVTSMMAFFLVMWLIASVSKDQRAAIFQYFKNPSMEVGKSAHPAPAQNGPGGASTSMISLGGMLDARHSNSPISTGLGTPVTAVQPGKGALGNANSDITTEEQAKQVMQAAERKRLETLMVELRQAIDKSQALKPFKDQLLLDVTPEGLRIQIVDAQNRPMFDLGSAKLKDYTGKILKTLAPYLNSVPNRLSLTGHTDTTPYTARAGYNNWDLSADRANAARRALEAGGLTPEKVVQVVGLSSAVLFDKTNPRAAINRRISIIVLTHDAEQSALKSDSTAPLSNPAAMPETLQRAGINLSQGASPSAAATTPAAAISAAASPAAVPSAPQPARPAGGPQPVSGAQAASGLPVAAAEAAMRPLAAPSAPAGGRGGQ